MIHSEIEKNLTCDINLNFPKQEEFRNFELQQKMDLNDMSHEIELKLSETLITFCTRNFSSPESLQT